MKIERLNLEDRQPLLDRLIGHVFHLTTRVEYEGIRKVGEVSNNESGCFPINTGSQNSYGRRHGYVCLFDFRENDSQTINNTRSCYEFLGPHWFAAHGRKYITLNLVYLFLDPQYYDHIIPNSRAHDHYKATGEFLQAISGSEVWIENRIPISWIQKTLLVKIREPMPDANTPEGMHFRAVLKASWKR